MDHDPKTRSWLYDLYGGAGEPACEPPEDPIGKFLEKLDLQTALGRPSTSLNKSAGTDAPAEPVNLTALRAFVFEAKEKMPTFTKISQFKDSLRGLAKVLTAMAKS